MSKDEGEPTDDSVRLGWKDYLALFAAALETVGLPVLVFIFVVVVVLVLTRSIR